VRPTVTTVRILEGPWLTMRFTTTYGLSSGRGGTSDGPGFVLVRPGDREGPVTVPDRASTGTIHSRHRFGQAFVKEPTPF